MRRFIKKIFLAVSVLAILISTVLSVSSCALILPKVTEKLPDEEISKVIISVDGMNNEAKAELPEEKISLFSDYLQKLTYKRRINWRGLKCRPLSEKWFIINYENYTVKLGEHDLVIYSGDDFVRDTADELLEAIVLSGIYPEDTFAEMFALFEN